MVGVDRLDLPQKLLYFPYINVPRSRWLTQALLYWDQILTITPSEYLLEAQGVNQNTRTLVDAGMVVPVMPPWELVTSPLFFGQFLALLESSDLESRRHGEAHLVPFPIHQEKLGMMIYRELEGLGLATRIVGSPNFLAIEAITAEQFMAYLAAAVANFLGPGHVCGTDEKRFLAAMSRRFTGRPSILMADDELRHMVLSDLLPGPADVPDVRDLVSFREKYRDELKRFRRRVESKIQEVSLTADWEHRKIRASIVAAELCEERDELAAAMRQSRLGIITNGTLMSVGSAGLSLSAAAATGEPVAAVASLLSLAAAVVSSIKPKIGVRGAPMAYAAISQQFADRRPEPSFQ